MSIDRTRANGCHGVVAWKSTVKVRIIASTRSSGSTHSGTRCARSLSLSLTRSEETLESRSRRTLYLLNAFVKHWIAGWEVVKPLRPYRVSATRARWIAFIPEPTLNIDTATRRLIAPRINHTTQGIQVDPFSNRFQTGSRLGGGKVKGRKRGISKFFCHFSAVKYPLLIWSNL